MLFTDVEMLQNKEYKTALRKYRKALRYLNCCWDKEDMDEGFHFVVELVIHFEHM